MTRHPWIVLIVGIILAVPLAYMKQMTPLNYDIFTYMPEDVESVKGQQILHEHFQTANTAYILLNTTNVPFVLRIQKDVSLIDGVQRVSWINEVVDPSVPDSFVPQQLLGIYKKGSYSLLHLSFAEPSSSAKTLEAIKQIKSYLGKKATAFTGLPIFLYELRELMESEKLITFMAAACFSSLVIGISLGSWAIPIIFMLSIGIGVIYNLGTNYFMGEVSYITSAIASAIQLGVIQDFSIFLIHRYHEEKKLFPDPQKAMESAIANTLPAILPSALTCMAGFLALILMKMRLGLDMGFVMAKGVFMGLAVTMTLLPAMLLVANRFVKTRGEKTTSAIGTKISTFLVNNSGRITVLFILLFIPMIWGKTHVKISYDLDEMLPRNLESIKCLETIKNVLGSMEISYIVFPDTIPRFRQENAIKEIRNIKGIVSVIALTSLADSAVPESFIPDKAKALFSKGGYSMIMVKFSDEPGSTISNQAVDSIRSAVEKAGIKPSWLAGTTPINKDMMDISKRDIPVVDMASLISIIVIIALFMRSVSIPFVLVAAIELAIYTNLSIPYAMGRSIPFLTITSISSIQLATTVDFSILLMTRYSQWRKKLPKKEAMIKALSGGMGAITISGLSLAAATSGIALTSHVSAVSSLTLMIARGALISTAVIVFLLPSFILTCDKIITHTSIGFLRKKGEEA
ncbi:MAG TPA: MMPL family transporter [Desulfomonilia bacterium]